MPPPGKLGSSPVPSAPAVGVPRKAKAARSGSPATTAGKAVFWMPNGAPTSWEADQVTPRSWETATRGWPSPLSKPK